MQFAGFPSIEGFVNIVKLVGAYPHLADKPFTYRGKIKLHGTNAAVRVHKGEIIAQSRENIITPEKDNAGFARWVETNRDYWKNLADNESPELTFFGEWCGPGIMRGTAINQIPNKIFAVFAVMIGGVGFDENSEFPKEDHNPFIVEPEAIEALLGNRPADVFVLPWSSHEPFTIDWLQRDTLQPTVDRLNALISELEPSDPWVKATFGVEGTAEGIVYYPTLDGLTRKQFSNFAFKVKGEKHKIKKTKEAVQIDPEVAKNIDEFVAMFVTEPRCEQGLAAVGNLEMKNIGSFLKWMGTDVAKESTAELEASGLSWDQVQKSVQTAARTWFMSKCNAI